MPCNNLPREEVYTGHNWLVLLIEAFIAMLISFFMTRFYKIHNQRVEFFMKRIFILILTQLFLVRTVLQYIMRSTEEVHKIGLIVAVILIVILLILKVGLTKYAIQSSKEMVMEEEKQKEIKRKYMENIQTTINESLENNLIELDAKEEDREGIKEALMKNNGHLTNEENINRLVIKITEFQQKLKEEARAGNKNKQYAIKTSQLVKNTREFIEVLETTSAEEGQSFTKFLKTNVKKHLEGCQKHSETFIEKTDQQMKQYIECYIATEKPSEMLIKKMIEPNHEKEPTSLDKKLKKVNELNKKMYSSLLSIVEEHFNIKKLLESKNEKLRPELMECLVNVEMLWIEIDKTALEIKECQMRIATCLYVHKEE